MEVYLTEVLGVNDLSLSQDMITALVTQKTEDGYVMDMNGAKITVSCSLDFDIGDILKLKMVESSPSQIIFKVMQLDANKPQSTSSMDFDMSITTETKWAVDVLSKLNLPIKKENIDSIIKLFNQLMDTENAQSHPPTMKEPTFDEKITLFHESYLKYTNDSQNIKKPKHQVELPNEIPQEPESKLTAKPGFELSHTSETQLATKILSELNLPLEKENFIFIKELVHQLLGKENIRPDLPFIKQLPFKRFLSLFRQILNKAVNNNLKNLDEQLMESFQEFAATKSRDSTLKNASASNQTKAAKIKDYLGLKALTLLHDKGQGLVTNFYVLPLPLYHNIYLKVTSNFSNSDKEHIVGLNFIISTKSLGAVLVGLRYIDGKIEATSTFEEKKTKDIVKGYIKKNSRLHNLIQTMKLNVGKVSMKDFFFKEIKEHKISPGINLKV